VCLNAIKTFFFGESASFYPLFLGRARRLPPARALRGRPRKCGGRRSGYAGFHTAPARYAGGQPQGAAPTGGGTHAARAPLLSLTHCAALRR
jgi:hypothetical protein